MFTVHILETRKDGSIFSNRCFGVFPTEQAAARLASQSDGDWDARQVLPLKETPDAYYVEAVGKVFYTTDKGSAQPEFERTADVEFIPTRIS